MRLLMVKSILDLFAQIMIRDVCLHSHISSVT